MDKSDNVKTQKRTGIIILNCTYADRQKVQKFGAIWKNKWRAWCIDDSMNQDKLKRWLFPSKK